MSSFNSFKIEGFLASLYYCIEIRLNGGLDSNGKDDSVLVGQNVLQFYLDASNVNVFQITNELTCKIKQSFGRQSKIE